MSTLSLESRDSAFEFLFDRAARPARRPARGAAQGAASVTPGPAMRLTRRGRMVVLAAALLIAFVVGVFVSAAGSVATDRPGTPAPTRIVQVSDGDTLWGIASSLADGGDVRQMMTTIERLNALEGPDVQIGQRLVVPAG